MTFNCPMGFLIGSLFPPLKKITDHVEYITQEPLREQGKTILSFHWTIWTTCLPQMQTSCPLLQGNAPSIATHSVWPLCTSPPCFQGCLGHSSPCTLYFLHLPKCDSCPSHALACAAPSTWISCCPAGMAKIHCASGAGWAAPLPGSLSWLSPHQGTSGPADLCVPLPLLS